MDNENEFYKDETASGPLADRESVHSFNEEFASEGATPAGVGQEFPAEVTVPTEAERAMSAQAETTQDLWTEVADPTETERGFTAQTTPAEVEQEFSAEVSAPTEAEQELNARTAPAEAEQEIWTEVADPDPTKVEQGLTAQEATPVEDNAEFYSFDEEYASEVASPSAMMGAGVLNNPEEDRPDTGLTRRRDETDMGTNGRIIGWVALALSVVSLFIYPVLMGATAVVLGIIAYAQGRRALGVWSIVIGGLALLSYFVLVPYYT